MTPNPIMTRGYELDSFGMPKPTPADRCDSEDCAYWQRCMLPDECEFQPSKTVWTDSMRQFWGIVDGR
jgi:hypothetical protein